MASVASALIATTTNTTSADLPSYSGTTVEHASVAEAPQTAVPTPTSAPKPGERPPHEAKTKPQTIVATIPAMTSTAVSGPSAAMSVKPTRRPRSATAQRNTVRTQKAMPGCVAGFAAIGLSAMPTTSAITMLGIGTNRPT